MMCKTVIARRLVVLLLFGMIAGSVSCQWMEREFGYGADQKTDSAVEQPRDIPVPADAVFKPSLSYVLYPAGRKARVARYVYLTEEGERYLKRFYDENMKYGWERSEYDAGADQKMHFISSNELCKIHFEELSTSTQRRLDKTSRIVIEIDPIDK